jgi:hypothetical protein
MKEKILFLCYLQYSDQYTRICIYRVSTEGRNPASPTKMKAWSFKQFIIFRNINMCLQCAAYQPRREIAFVRHKIGAFPP